MPSVSAEPPESVDGAHRPHSSHSRSLGGVKQRTAAASPTVGAASGDAARITRSHASGPVAGTTVPLQRHR